MGRGERMMRFRFDDEIEYKFFDMDRNRFCLSQSELTMGLPVGSLIRLVPYGGSFLIAAGSTEFTEASARYRAHRMEKKL